MAAERRDAERAAAVQEEVAAKPEPQPEAEIAESKEES